MLSGIIEMIGPPGVGKTAIYDALCRTWNLKSKWIYPEALMISRSQTSGAVKSLDLLLRRLLRKKVSKAIPVDYGLRFATNNQALAEFYWRHLSDVRVYTDEEYPLRFRSAYFLFSDFCKYEAAIEQETKLPCIINEGFLQKTFLLNSDEDFMKNTLASYLTLVPLPNAIFHVTAPNKYLIVQRLLNRRKIIASHVGKNYKDLLVDTERWQHLLDLILVQMESLHVPIYTIDASKSIKENVRYLQNLLNNKLSNSKTTIEYSGNRNNAHRLPHFN